MLVGKVACPIILFTPAFWIGCHLPIDFFLITRYIPSTLVFSSTSFSAVSDQDSLSRDFSVLGGCFDGSMSLMFLEGVSKWYSELVIISMQDGLPDTPTFLVVSALVPRLIFPGRSFLDVISRFCLLFSFVQGDSKILGGTNTC